MGGEARRRRFRTWAYGLTAVGHAPLAFGCGRLLPAPYAAALVLVVCVGVLARLRALRTDGRRPVWVTRLVDEPLFCHWGACMLSVPLFAVASFLGLVGLAFLSGDLLGAARAGALGAYGLGLVISAWAVWGERRFVRVVQHEVRIPHLDPVFDGYRLVQLSDLHVGSYDRLACGLAWAKLANAQEPDSIVVTGDLVTSGTAFYEDVARVIGTLRARDGVFVSPGNHDQWDERSLIRSLESRGAVVLRNASTIVRRGDAVLNVAGLGDWSTGADDLDSTLAGCRTDAPVVLLSHYPRFFEEAARRGVALVLSGHTHGGQIGVPGFVDRINVATLSGQRARGLFRRGSTTLYVNAGLGTTGPPMRLGIPPEIAVLVLRCDTSNMEGK